MDNLPKVLVMLMDSLLSSCDIQSWNIYNEKDGKCTMKIRFAGHSSDKVLNSTPVSYKKISAKQSERNRQRAADHKNSVKCAMVNRDISEIGVTCEIEQKRGVTINDSLVSDSDCVISPEYVQPSITDVNDMSNMSDIVSSPIHTIPGHGRMDCDINKQNSIVLLSDQLVADDHAAACSIGDSEENEVCQSQLQTCSSSHIANIVSHTPLMSDEDSEMSVLLEDNTIQLSNEKECDDVSGLKTLKTGNEIYLMRFQNFVKVMSRSFQGQRSRSNS